MKKRMKMILAVALVLLVGIGGILGWNWYQDTYITIDEQTYRRDITEMDLSGTAVQEMDKLAELTQLERLDLRDTGLTVEEYEYLRQALPDCQILWSVPFQEGYLALETTAVSVTRLDETDIGRLGYLEHLASVDATGCQDYEMLMKLKQARPELEIHYNVSIGGRDYPDTTAELTLENAEAAEVEEALLYLPELTRVTFTGNAPENEQIYAWMCQYPDTVFVWTFDVCGVSATSLDTELILNEIPMESVDDVESSLKYFYDLQWVEMCDCGIPSEEMDALWKRHPETRFVWKVHLANCVLRTDDVAFIPYKFGYGIGNELYDADCTELKYCVDMVCLDLGHMKITDYSFLEHMPKLKYLILVDTQGTDFSPIVNCKELIFFEVFLTDFSDAELLRGLTKLEDLNLSYTKVSNIELLTEMPWLDRLWLPGNYLPYEIQQTLTEGLPDTYILFSAFGSTDKGWRQSQNYYDMRDLLEMPYLP